MHNLDCSHINQLKRCKNYAIYPPYPLLRKGLNKKQLLCTAVMSALALMSGAASATQSTITDQNGLNSLGLNGSTTNQISFDAGNQTAFNPSTSLNAIGNNNAVLIKGKDIVTVNASNNVEKTFNFVKMSDLTLEATHHGIYLDSTLTGVHIGRQGVNGEEDPLNNVTITAGSGHAIYVKTGDWAGDNPNYGDMDNPQGKSNVSILAQNIKLVSTEKSAIYIEGKWSTDNSTFETHPDVEISDIKGVHQKLWMEGKHYSIEASDGASLTVGAEEIDLKGGIKVNRNAWVELGYQNKTDFPDSWGPGFDTDADVKVLDKVTVTAKENKAALDFEEGGLLTVAAKNVSINADKGIAVSVKTKGDSKHIDNTVVDLYAEDTLRINGDIIIDTRKGIGADGYVKISADKNVVINGDIDLKTNKKNAQAVNIILDGAGSSFTGKINTLIENSASSTIALFARKDAAAKDANKVVAGTNIAIRNGATLNATGDSSITNIDADGGVINADKSKVTIDKLNTGVGGTTIKSTDPKANQIAIDSNVGNGKIGVEVDLTNNTTFNGKDEELRKALGSMIAANSNQNTNKVSITATGNMTDMTVDKDLSTNEVTGGLVTTSEVLLSLNDIASNQMLAWRAQINDVSKRMGDLRTYDTESGGWVRMFGSRSKYGDRNMDNKSTTIQVGTDRRVAGNGYVGLTAHYSEGDGDLVNGSTENKAFGFGVYGGWLADDGQFVDVILKRTRMDTDFKLKYATGTESNGDFKTWGTSLAVEYGWRLPYKSTAFWLEPQAEVTYGHLEDVDYTTSAGVNAHQKGMDSLVGRLGLSVGYTKDANTVYAKASVAHEFEGESSATMRSGQSLTLEQDIGGTWGEVAVGGTVRLNKSIAAYGEFQTTFGSPVETPYQWNVGVRFLW